MTNTFTAVWNTPFIREVRKGLLARKDLFHEHEPLLDFMERTEAMDEDALCAAMLYLHLGGDYEFGDEIRPYMSPRVAEMIDTFKDHFISCDTTPFLTAASLGPLQFMMSMWVQETEEILAEIIHQEEMLDEMAQERRKSKPPRSRRKTKVPKESAPENANDAGDDDDRPLTDEEKVEQLREINYATMKYMAGSMIDLLQRMELRDVRDSLPPKLVKAQCKVLRDVSRQLCAYDMDEHRDFVSDVRKALDTFEIAEKPFNRASRLNYSLQYSLPPVGKLPPRKLVMKFHVN